MYSTFGSMTQMSASVMSRSWLVVRSSSPQKMASCCAINSAANVSPATMPRYFARSPASIFSAIQFMESPPSGSSEHRSRREHDHPPQADHARQDNNQRHGDRGTHGNLPGHEVRRRIRFQLHLHQQLQHRREAHAETVTDQPHGGSLQEDHADEGAVAHAHGFEGAELLEVADREQVKRLPRDRSA